MQLHNPGAQIFIPDGTPEGEAIRRTTHLGVGGHPDDLEILAYHGILECFGTDGKWFSGIIVTNGAGSPRAGIYADFSDEQLIETRQREQKKAAVVGEYGFAALLDYPSSAAKDPTNEYVLEDLKKLIQAAQPSVMYTHSFADKHPTHIGVALRTIRALRELPEDCQPTHLYGCEIWRDLDWLLDEDKVVLDVSLRENLGASLLGIFDTQIAGGKRYDLATMGRRRAQATYHESHETDVSTGLIFAVDLTPLIEDPSRDVADYVKHYIDRFSRAVAEQIHELS